MGAYGQETYTLDKPGAFGGEYGGFGGTSGATPHVAGTIALMYSVDCPAYADLALENPADMALRIKDMLLTYVSRKHKARIFLGGPCGFHISSYCEYLWEQSDILPFDLRGELEAALRRLLNCPTPTS